jgi:hypothetical protein
MTIVEVGAQDKTTWYAATCKVGNQCDIEGLSSSSSDSAS